jgi:hypothetical protein
LNIGHGVLLAETYALDNKVIHSLGLINNYSYKMYEFRITKSKEIFIVPINSAYIGMVSNSIAASWPW